MIYILLVIILLVQIASFLSPDKIAIIKSKLFNFVYGRLNASCEYETYMNNLTFKPNISGIFTGCNTYIGKSKFHANSKGYRYSEDNIDNATFRIITLGDSVTFGWGLEDNQTFPFQLEKILNSRCGKKVKVINLGIPGMSSTDEVIILNRTINQMKPNVILVTFVGNDWETAELSKLHDDYIMNLKNASCKDKCSEEEEFSFYFKAQHFMRITNFNLTYNVVGTNYKKLDNLAKKHNSIIMGGYYPVELEWLVALNKTYDELNWEKVDLRKFHQYPRYYINILDTHPNKLASKEIAETYAMKIQKYCK